MDFLLKIYKLIFLIISFYIWRYTRKKLLKMERKERRAEKKKLKNAFKEEKVSQQRQIAQANKIVRYGLSVKDI